MAAFNLARVRYHTKIKKETRVIWLSIRVKQTTFASLQGANVCMRAGKETL